MNDRRKQTRGNSRWVYFVLLMVLAVAVLNYVAGDYVIFRADGVVVQNRVDVEAEYAGRLDKVFVRIGQRVEEGEPLVVYTSIEIADRLAELRLRLAELRQRDIEKKEEIEVAGNLLPIAEERASHAEALRASYEQLSDKGLAAADRMLDILTESNAAQELLIRLKARIASEQTAVEALKPALESAQLALERLGQHYGDGVIRAPVPGIAGSGLPAQGEVFLTGERMLSIYTGDRYVLAYLPSRHLFPVEVGEAVVVDTGQVLIEGSIEEILLVSDKLPEEFQNTFKPVERSQLARIVIRDPEGVSTNTKVQVFRRNETVRGLSEQVSALLTGLTDKAKSLFGGDS
ncbi:HlyD family secretion protein [Roseibium litorale]|uniref:Multidrug resistance efflux pump n=1 Tax=Roseibium litorale TaxID=2803841 RepID=A0ABR9CRZ9_9HYPH|nr:hypothetical protein [Roseibium litorale]MBD8893656.1 hypothetical protein [Roseibium litorale]